MGEPGKIIPVAVVAQWGQIATLGAGEIRRIAAWSTLLKANSQRLSARTACSTLLLRKAMQHFGRADVTVALRR